MTDEERATAIMSLCRPDNERAKVVAWIAAILAAGRAGEREACAKMLDADAQREGNDQSAYTLRQAAATIRARKP